MAWGRRLDGPVEHGTKVVRFLHDPVTPLELVTASQVRARGLRERHVVLGVAAPNGLCATACLESLLGVLADGLQEPVTHRTRFARAVRDDERLVDELTQHIHHVEHIERVIGQDGLGRGEVTTPREHRQASQRLAFAGFKKVI